MKEIRNFNESLLYHTVSNSQMKPSHLNNDKNITTNLFTDLNITYSRLTTQNTYEPINYLPQHRLIDYLTQNHQTDQSMEIQLEKCSKCKKIKKQLKKVELFLQQIENTFIQKQLILANQFKNISLELNKTKQQNQQFKDLYFKTLNELNALKKSSKPPKIDLISSRLNLKQKSQFYEASIKNLSTMQSQVSPQSKRLTNFLKKSINRPKITNQNDLFDSVIQSKDSKCLQNFDSSTIQLQYTESEPEQFSEFIETHKFNVIDSNVKSSPRQKSSKSNHYFHSLTKRDIQPQIYRHRTQDDNLKNFNTSLLDLSKPKTLASRIFNIYRN